LTRRGFFVCENPRKPGWELEPLAPEGFRLLGWRQSREDEIDAGVGDELASIFARALTRVALVTFPRSTDPQAETPVSFTSEDRIQILRPTGWRERLRVIASHSPVALSERLPFRLLLVSTRRSDVVKTLFDGAAWSMQAQAILLGTPDAPAPTMDWRAYMSLQEHPVSRDALASLGLAAIVLPGVDGDVAGLTATTAEFERQVLSSIEHEAVRSGFEWRVLPEDSFADAMANREQ